MHVEISGEACPLLRSAIDLGFRWQKLRGVGRYIATDGEVMSLQKNCQLVYWTDVGRCRAHGPEIGRAEFPHVKNGGSSSRTTPHAHDLV